MEINYNVMGTRRKKLVDVISETTGARAEYQFILDSRKHDDEIVEKML